MTCIYDRYLYLDAAAKAALLAHNTDGIRHELRVKETRDHLICALSGCKAGDTGNAEAMLLDLIGDAIANCLDDCLDLQDAARLVLDAPLDQVAPMPKQEAAE